MSGPKIRVLRHVICELPQGGQQFSGSEEVGGEGLYFNNTIRQFPCYLGPTPFKQSAHSRLCTILLVLKIVYHSRYLRFLQGDSLQI